MAKQPLKLSVRIPPCHAPRNEWRRKIHRAVLRKLKESTVAYDRGDKFEVEIRLYMTDFELSFHDIDNRLKDILDALRRTSGVENIRGRVLDLVFHLSLPTFTLGMKRQAENRREAEGIRQ